VERGGRKIPPFLKVPHFPLTLENRTQINFPTKKNGELVYFIALVGPSGTCGGECKERGADNNDLQETQRRPNFPGKKVSNPEWTFFKEKGV